MKTGGPPAEASDPGPRAAGPVVRLRFERFSSFVAEYAGNVSLGGLFVATSELRPIGQVVRLEVELADGFRLIEGVGEVVWVRPEGGGADRPAGVALRFRALDEQGRELILKILEEQVKGGGQPFDVDEVPDGADTTFGEPSAIAVTSAETQAPKPSGGDGPELEFRPPWGTELPDVPQEILVEKRPEPEPAAAGQALDDHRVAAPPVVPEPDWPIAADPPGDEAGMAEGGRTGAEPPVAAVAALAAASPASVRADLSSPADGAAGVADERGRILDYEADLFRDEPPRRRRRRALKSAGLVAVAAALLLVVGGWYFRRPLVGLAGLAVTEPPGVETAPPVTVGSRTVTASEPTQPPTPPSETAAEPAESHTLDGDPELATAPATRLADLSWRATGEGTEVVLVFDGQLDDRRIVHDRLDWAADREQLSLGEIELPYRPATIAVATPELKQIRTGIHSAAGVSELRLVFDFAIDGATISDLRSDAGRVRLLIRPPGS